MTLNEMLIKTRELSRVVDTSISDSELTNWINEGQRQFVKEAGGLIAEDYLQIEAKFDTRTFFAIRIETTGTNAVTAQDVAITDTNQTDVTGAQVATNLESQLQGVDGNFSVDFTSDRKFKVSQTGATKIIISSPSDSFTFDATRLLFGGPVSASADEVTGDAPEAVHVEADLPSDYHKCINVHWDKYLLRRINFNGLPYPTVYGTPYCYGVSESRMRFYPVPTEQGFAHMWYEKYPADLDSSTPSGESEIPEPYHMLVVYYAASKALESSFEAERAGRMYAFFKDGVKRYSRERTNENSQIPFNEGASVFTMFGNMAERSLT